MVKVDVNVLKYFYEDSFPFHYVKNLPHTKDILICHFHVRLSKTSQPPASLQPFRGQPPSAEGPQRRRYFHPS